MRLFISYLQWQEFILYLIEQVLALIKGNKHQFSQAAAFCQQHNFCCISLTP